MKPIQKANIDDGIQRMTDARARSDKAAFDDGYQLVEETLKAIKISDSATYEKYIYLLNEHWD